MKKTNTFALALCAALAACGDDDPENGNGNGGGGNGNGASLEIAGTYSDQFMTETTFSNETVGAATVVEFSNQDNVLFTQNPSDAMFNPDAYSRFVWTEPESDGSFFGCFDVFDAATLEEAKNRPDMADEMNPTGEMACGGAFSFSDYTPVE